MSNKKRPAKRNKPVAAVTAEATSVAQGMPVENKGQGRIRSMVKLNTKEYQLLGGRIGISFILKTGKDVKRRLTVFDEQRERNMAIRHCPDEISIFVEDQNENAFVEPIIFYRGHLQVDRTKQATQKFLANHPDNKINGGSLFEEIDDELEAEKAVDLTDVKINIYNAVRNKIDEANGEMELEALVAVLDNSVEKASKMGIESLKRRIYQEIESSPNYFLNEKGDLTIFEDDYITTKYFILRAIQEGVIKKSPNNRTMNWVKDNAVIAVAPSGTELIEFFTDYLGTQSGLLVGQEINKRS